MATCEQRSIEIAEHLWTVLEVMARDMATEPRALVNQAVFNWARRNGYAVSASAPVEAPALTPAPVEASAPSPVPVGTPASVKADEAAPASPNVLARIAAIDAEVDRYVRLDADAADQDTETADEGVEAANDAIPLSDEGVEAVSDATPPSDEVEEPVTTPVDMAAITARMASIDADVQRYVVPAKPEVVPASAIAFTPAPAANAAAEDKPRRKRLETTELDALTAGLDDLLEMRNTVVAPSPRFTLELRIEGTEHRCIVDEKPAIIGRGSHCTLVVPSPDVSREHIKVTRTGDTSYVIEDCGSSNGTWIGDDTIQQRQVRDGDIYRIGGASVVATLRLQLPKDAVSR